MNFGERQKLYEQLEAERQSKVVALITSERPNMETQIAPDCVDPFIDLLDEIGPTKRISLVIHTNGGDALSAWRLVNLIRTFCDDLEVLVPSKAMSAGTLIAIGSNNIVMTKQAALGPIDPSINTPLNPQFNQNGQMKIVPVSVEAVRGYLDAARDELGIKDSAQLTQVLVDLTSKIHPLVIGQIFRSRAQIRFLARKLIEYQVSDEKQKNSVIDFLCADSGSHDYTMNRREAASLGLNVEKPSQEFYELLKKIHASYSKEMKLLQPYSQAGVLGNAAPGVPVAYKEVRGLIESAAGCYQFVSEGEVSLIQVQTPVGMQNGFSDNRSFEGWKKLP